MIFGLVITRKETAIRLDEGGGIRCPTCRWEPSKESRWYCSGEPDTCGHCWNTFETRGVCPGCRKQWHTTVCLSCGAVSPHDDWYVKEHH